MARPRKRTVDYFPHDVDHGKTLHVIENQFGNDGYSFWFKLLEILGSTDGHAFDFSSEENAMYLSSRTNLSIDKCKKILDLLAKLDAIDKKLWNESSLIWSDNFVDGVREVYEKRSTSCPENPRFRDENPPKTTGNSSPPDDSRDENPPKTGVSDTKTTENQSSDGGSRGVSEEKTQQSKVKESKASTSTSSSVESSDSPSLDEADNASEKIKRPEMIQLVREKAERRCRSDTKAKCITSAFGKVIFNRGLSDKELRWIIENHGDELFIEMMQADSKNDVFSFFNQHMNSTVRPEMQEARLWKEDDSSHVDERVEKLVSSFTENHDVPEGNDFNRQEQAKKIEEEYGQ